MVKNFTVLFIFLVLILPYILLFKNIELVNMDWRELASAFQNTIIQSALSAIAVIALGFWGAMGLSQIKNSKTRKYFEFLCLIPSFLPALFFVTAILQVIRPFPFGLAGIIIIHVLMYVGLATLFVYSVFENKFYSLSELAYLEGASRSQFVLASIKNMYFEIGMVFLFLFVQFFTSFAVPLLVGMQSLTVETLIYEKIRTTGEFSGALLISLLESVFIAILLLLYKSKTQIQSIYHQRLYLLNSKSGLVFIVLPVFLFIVGSLMGSAIGFEQLKSTETDLIPLVLKSVGNSLFTGIALLIFLSLITYSYKNKFLDKFLLSFIPLSTVLIALSFLLMNFNLGFIEQDLKFVTAMLILFLPVLYRYKLKSELARIEPQIEVANLMGANDFLIFSKIIFPQVFPTILFLSGLGAFWAIGDFAISQIIYGRDVTLALYIQSLVGSYKLELANLFVIVLLFLGALVFIIFKEMRYVVSQKH